MLPVDYWYRVCWVEGKKKLLVSYDVRMLLSLSLLNVVEYVG